MAPRVAAAKGKSCTSEPEWRLESFSFLHRCGTLSFAPPTQFTRVLTVCSMASSAKRRAVGLGENPEESEDSSVENPEEEDDSGEEDSDASEEEINEVKELSSLNVDAIHGLSSQLVS